MRLEEKRVCGRILLIQTGICKLNSGSWLVIGRYRVTRHNRRMTAENINTRAPFHWQKTDSLLSNENEPAYPSHNGIVSYAFRSGRKYLETNKYRLRLSVFRAWKKYIFPYQHKKSESNYEKYHEQWSAMTRKSVSYWENLWMQSGIHMNNFRFQNSFNYKLKGPSHTGALYFLKKNMDNENLFTMLNCKPSIFG